MPWGRGASCKTRIEHCQDWGTQSLLGNLFQGLTTFTAASLLLCPEHTPGRL